MGSRTACARSQYVCGGVCGGVEKGGGEKGAISLCGAMCNLFHSTPTQLNLTTV